MAIRTRFDLRGLTALIEELSDLNDNIDEAVGEALNAGADELLSGMIARARERTGNLKSKLKKSAVKMERNFSFIDIGLIDADAETARYGNAQEFGTSSMAGQSYIRAAFDEDMARARAKMRKVLQERMK